MFRLKKLILTRFRSYEQLVWRPRGMISVITGSNGSGKTNLLEAVSLLVPGRGLRRARIGELGRHGAPWGIVGSGDHDGVECEVATGTPPDGSMDRRIFRIDGVPTRSQADVAAIVAAVWLTPQMDRLFGESASGRLRFLDRLVWTLEPEHARQVAALSNAMASRNRLLAMEPQEHTWLDAVEHSLARHAVSVAAARSSTVGQLNASMASHGVAGFPRALIRLHDIVADQLSTRPALAVEDWLRTQCQASRSRSWSGLPPFDTHRADFEIIELDSGQDAASASTGQQKSLLINLVLGHAALVAAARGAPPLLLFDEVAVHLDSSRRAALWTALSAASAQILLTGTDRDAFDGLSDGAEFLSVESDTLRPIT